MGDFNMYNNIINLLNKWGTDIHSMSFKHYDDFIELLINGHYIIILEKIN